MGLSPRWGRKSWLLCASCFFVVVWLLVLTVPWLGHHYVIMAFAGRVIIINFDIQMYFPRSVLQFSVQCIVDNA